MNVRFERESGKLDLRSYTYFWTIVTAIVTIIIVNMYRKLTKHQALFNTCYMY